LIVGKKEMEEKSVTLRTFGSKDQEKIKLDNLTDFFEKKCIIPVR
jgi:threonyl-tRNA synthetase